MSITGLVAIYAALVASIALGWKIYDIRRDRSCIRVKSSFAHISGGEFYGYHKGKYISLTAMNIGRRPVTLNSAGFRLSNRIDLTLFPHGEFPYRVNEGEKHDVFFDFEELKEGLGKEPSAIIKFVWFRDATGRIHKGKLTKKIRQALMQETPNHE